jgi:hypothetical protein
VANSRAIAKEFGVYLFGYALSLSELPVDPKGSG